MARLLRDDLDMLQDFHHSARHKPPPLAPGEATIAWVHPATRLELAAYATCDEAGRAWGVPESWVADCVAGRAAHANGLEFESRGWWPPPRCARKVQHGVYLLNGRFRAQLGSTWGFLRNFSSEAAAVLVRNRALRYFGVQPGAASRRVPVDKGRGRGKIPCPACESYVGTRTLTCPDCGYDFKGAREADATWKAPTSVTLRRPEPTSFGVRIKLGGRVAPGALVAERPGRRRPRTAPRAARLDDEDDSNTAAATRAALLAAVDELTKSAESAFFREPVDTLYVPDYLAVVAKPMDLSTLRGDITRKAATSVKQLADALTLIVNNAKRYNPPGHLVHEAATAFAPRVDVAVDAARGKILARPYIARSLTTAAVWRGSAARAARRPGRYRRAGLPPDIDRRRASTLASRARYASARPSRPTAPAGLASTEQSCGRSAVRRTGRTVLPCARYVARRSISAPCWRRSGHTARRMRKKNHTSGASSTPSKPASPTSARPGRGRARTARFARRARTRRQSCCAMVIIVK